MFLSLSGQNLPGGGAPITGVAGITGGTPNDDTTTGGGATGGTDDTTTSNMFQIYHELDFNSRI